MTELTCKGQIYKFVKSNSKNGVTQGQIYKGLPMFAPSTIRNDMTALKNDGLFTLSQCQCGHATVYRVKLK